MAERRNVDDVRVGRVDANLRDRLRIGEADVRPRLAAVGRLEHAAFIVGRRRMAERRNVDDVGVGRVDANLRDRLGIGEARVRPRLAGVDRFVDAVALHDVAADARLAHTDEHDVGIALGDRDGADRRAFDLAVGHRIPRLAAVGRLPQSAADRPEVVLVNADRAARGRDRTAAAHGADAAPLQRFEKALVITARLRARDAELADRGNDRERAGKRCAADAWPLQSG